MLGSVPPIKPIGMVCALLATLFVSTEAEARYGAPPGGVAVADDGAGAGQVGPPDAWALVKELEHLKAESDKKDAELRVLR